MTPRSALAILMRPAPTEGDDAQMELTRMEAVEAIALALGFAREAAIARQVAESILAKDEQQLRLFKLLDGENLGGDGK